MFVTLSTEPHNPLILVLIKPYENNNWPSTQIRILPKNSALTNFITVTLYQLKLEEPKKLSISHQLCFKLDAKYYEYLNLLFHIDNENLLTNHRAILKRMPPVGPITPTNRREKIDNFLLTTKFDEVI